MPFKETLMQALLNQDPRLESSKKVEALVYAINNAKDSNALLIWDFFANDPRTTSSELERVHSLCVNKLHPLFLSRFSFRRESKKSREEKRKVH